MTGYYPVCGCRRGSAHQWVGPFGPQTSGQALQSVDIFRPALDLAQTPAEHVVFIDNTAMFVKIAEGLGMRGIVHEDHKSTRAKLASFGLQMDGGRLQETEPTTQSGVDRMTAEVVTQL